MVRERLAPVKARSRERSARVRHVFGRCLGPFVTPRANVSVRAPLVHVVQAPPSSYRAKLLCGGARAPRMGWIRWGRPFLVSRRCNSFLSKMVARYFMRLPQGHASTSSPRPSVRGVSPRTEDSASARRRWRSWGARSPEARALRLLFAPSSRRAPRLPGKRCRWARGVAASLRERRAQPHHKQRSGAQVHEALAVLGAHLGSGLQSKPAACSRYEEPVAAVVRTSAAASAC